MKATIKDVIGDSFQGAELARAIQILRKAKVAVAELRKHKEGWIDWTRRMIAREGGK